MRQAAAAAAAKLQRACNGIVQLRMRIHLLMGWPYRRTGCAQYGLHGIDKTRHTAALFCQDEIVEIPQKLYCAEHSEGFVALWFTDWLCQVRPLVHAAFSLDVQEPQL